MPDRQPSVKLQVQRSRARFQLDLPRGFPVDDRLPLPCELSLQMHAEPVSKNWHSCDSMQLSYEYRESQETESVYTITNINSCDMNE